MRLWLLFLPKFNWLIGRVTGVKLHDYGCSLKAYRLELVEDMHLWRVALVLPSFGLHRRARITSAPPCHAMVEVNMASGGRSGGDGFVNDFVYEDVPHTTDARIWAVWSAFDGLGNRVGLYLTFLKLGLGQSNRPC